MVMSKYGRNIFLLGVIHFISCIDHTYYLRRDNSLIAPYSNPWTPVGSTFYTPNYVRLTGDIKSSRGAIYNTYPLVSRDWEVHIAFRVHGSTGSMFGDGFAFWLVQNKYILGSAFGGPEIFRGLAVFFDTYKNNQEKTSKKFPYISAMVNNGSKKFDHDLDGMDTILAGCDSDFRNKPLPSVAAIRYSRNTLTVSLDINSQGQWKECFKIDGVHLPTEYHLGLSAATGDLTDVHDIHYLKTYELDMDYTAEELLKDLRDVEPRVEGVDALLQHQSDISLPPGWSIWNILLWIFGILFLVGLIFIAYSCYQRGKNRRKRLY